MRRAFTIIEVLVVVTIIGVLIALLLPAVQSARDSARRTQCASNLKQIGIALLNFENANKHFPSGYVSNYDNAGNDTGPGWGWCAFILPEMEENAIYQTIHFDLPIEHPMNGALEWPISKFSSVRPTIRLASGPPKAAMQTAIPSPPFVKLPRRIT